MPNIDSRNLKSAVEAATQSHPRAVLTVRSGTSGASRPIFADRGLSRMLPNPLKANQDGRFPMFFLEDGVYAVRAVSRTGDVLYDEAAIDIRSDGSSDIAYGFSKTEALLQDALFSYSDTPDGQRIGEGDIVHAYDTGFSYRVCPAEEAEPHLVTQGGVKLKVLPGAAGYDITAFRPESAAQYQAVIDKLPEGATLNHPAGWSMDLDDGIVIDKPLSLTGPGVLRFTAGVAQKAGLQCTADGCTFSGLRLCNPNALQAQDGGRNYGIEIMADEVLVEGCEIDGFQNGIAVRASGEFHNIRIIGNRVKDCIGAGGGQASASAFGEDRGDGIVVWGAMATIQGNIVNARSGQDCRIGIHVEGLPGFKTTSAPHDDAMMAITGNVVYGPFRRGIVNENCTAVAITGNTVADSTWWGICMVEGAAHSVASGNTVIWTSPHDTWGSWGPSIAPLKLMQSVDSCEFVSNKVFLKAGSACAVIMDAENTPVGATGRQIDCAFRNNSAFAEDATATVSTAAIRVSEFGGTQAIRPVVEGNVVRSFAPNGILLEPCTDPRVHRNTVISLEPAPVAGQYGIFINNSVLVNPSIKDNLISGWNQGIRLPSMSGGEARGNTIADCTTGIWCGSTISKFWMTENRFRAVSGMRITGGNNAIRPWIRDNDDQMAYAETAYNPPGIAAGGSNTTTITVPGAAVNDHVQVAREASLGGLILSAHVSAADTVTLVHFNPTGATVDLPNADYRIIVQKYGPYA